MVSFRGLLGLTSAIAFSKLAMAATSCDPLSATNCPADKALATDITEYFTKNSSYFEIEATPTGISYSEEGLKMTLSERFDDPTIKSNFYIMFGRVEVHMKSGNGTGIVSSFYLQSDDLDEVDIEILGGDTTQVQSNYFSKGDTSTYDRGEFHSTSTPPQDSYFNYTLDWTEEQIVWYINGESVRTLKNTSSEGYPQTPMYIKTGIWAGGDSSNAPGTIEWAGGLTDYDDAPFSMYINKLLVSDYSTGTSYSYGDQSGDWTSIIANDGEVNGRISEVDSDASSESSSSSSSTSSTSASSISTSFVSSSTQTTGSTSETHTTSATTIDSANITADISTKSTADSSSPTTLTTSSSIREIDTSLSSSTTSSSATASPSVIESSSGANIYKLSILTCMISAFSIIL